MGYATNDEEADQCRDRSNDEVVEDVASDEEAEIVRDGCRGGMAPDPDGADEHDRDSEQQADREPDALGALGAFAGTGGHVAVRVLIHLVCITPGRFGAMRRSGEP